jgi:hypothetical protein
MPIATGSDQIRAAAPAPARMNARTISSVAYADELIASELKIASAFFFGSRSPSSSSECRGRPMAIDFSRAHARPVGVAGALAAGFATSWLGPV